MSSSRNAEPCELAEQVLDNARISKADVLGNRIVLEAGPQSINMDVSNRCNLRCIICPYHWTEEDMRKAEVMPSELFCDIGRELFPTARVVYLFGGGECFLHPQWDEIFDFARQWTFLPVISTNGMLVTERRIRALVEAGTQLRISFDGSNPATFNKVREGADFHRVLRNIDRLADFRAREAPRGRFMLRFSVTAYDENIREAPDIVELASMHGVEQVVFHHLMVDRNPLAGHELAHFPELSDEMFALASERGVELGVRVQVPAPFDHDSEAARRLADLAPRLPADRHAPYVEFPQGPDRTFTCRVPWVETWIKPNGLVSPCCVIAEEYDLGSVRDGGFATVWNGERYQAFRHRINSPRPPSPCTADACVYRIHQVNDGRLKRDDQGRIQLDSCCPGMLRSEFVEHDVRLMDHRLRGSVTVRNTGDTTWLSEVGGDETGSVRLGIKVLDERSDTRARDHVRVLLPNPVPPGGEAAFELDQEIPADADGCLIDLVDEGIAWFEEMGTRPLYLWRTDLE